MLTPDGYEWDDRKDAANVAKHGVAFDLARRIFEGRVLTAPDDRADYGERREVSVGVADGAVLTVVHTEREGRRRIISARPASQRERQGYERQAGRSEA